ncbi:MAG TPA: tetratricopeptide repeat protein [Bryobacteraceae bacterium]|nr:tetratricopeptide repeat protein [Bryobacteraceae bacterium]
MGGFVKTLFLIGCVSSLCRSETVLVAPFFNLSNSANLDWIGESIAETIRESLIAHDVLALNREERQEAFRRLSIRPYAVLTRASVVKLGQSLDAGKVIFGQYEVTPGIAPSKGSLKITSRILDLNHIRQGSELTELGALEDLASIETHLAWRALVALSPKKAPSEEAFRRSRPALRVDAMENYVRGLVATAPDQKHRFFTQAARLDARFSQPCFQLGRLYTRKKDYRVALGWLERVDRLDSHYYEAQFLLGLCRYYTGDYAGAETAFRMVSEAVPLNEVFNNLGAAQSRRDSPQTLDSFKKALEGDDSDPDYHFNIGYVLWKQGRLEEAADRFRASLDRKPNDPDATLMLGRCLSRSAPRPNDPKRDGMERLKVNFEETAYRQLKAELGVK